MGVQQALQQGGAGALQSSDQDDWAEADVMYLGMPSEQLLDPQPLNQRVGKPRLLYQPAGCGQSGFVVDRLDEHLQGTKVFVPTEVGQPGLPLRMGDE